MQPRDGNFKGATASMRSCWIARDEPDVMFTRNTTIEKSVNALDIIEPLVSWNP